MNHSLFSEIEHQVKPAHFRYILRKAILDTWLDPKYYQAHGLRSGWVMDLYKGGESVCNIKRCAGGDRMRFMII